MKDVGHSEQTGIVSVIPELFQSIIFFFSLQKTRCVGGSVVV